MASTYSPALRLELMATGDQSGTWGDTTNTNLGTLLEQAITGYLSVAQGDVANLTLTTNNGASDQARNAVVRVTGALTATRNVVVQTANKMYTVVNATTGGFSIVVKTSAGTGVSIPPGATIDVYSDGTNVVPAQNYWSGQIGGSVYLDAGATVGPVMDLFRDSTSPAASDILGQVVFNGRDSAGNKQEYGSIQAVISDATSTSEDASLDFYRVVAGTRTLGMSLGSVLAVPAASTAGGSQLVVRSDVAAQSDQETATSTTTFVSPGRQQYHPSATKAWVGFDTAGSRAAGSYNVSSVTDTGVGDWTVNYTVSFSSGSSVPIANGPFAAVPLIYNTGAVAAGTTRIVAFSAAGTLTDPTSPALIYFCAYGDQ